MPKGTPYTPYLEIVLAVAVMLFLVVVIAGGFNHRPGDVAQVMVDPGY
jgi:hypothetical protein